ncbi:MAG: hypothetical protein VX815_19375 [Gemmatimonadota bacterium]|nr:hypothetical protein [Gemmatimonadota bacterium]
MEIGLRLALGAEVGAVRWIVVSEGARLLGASNSDPLTFIGMPVLLEGFAVAPYVRGRRDPGPQ